MLLPFILKGFCFWVFFFFLKEYWQISCLWINPPTIWGAMFLTQALETSLQALAHWLLVLSKDPPLQGVPDTPFTFSLIWHFSRRARDPLLGFCYRSDRGNKPPRKAGAANAGDRWTTASLMSIPSLQGTCKGQAEKQGSSRKHI